MSSSKSFIKHLSNFVQIVVLELQNLGLILKDISCESKSAIKLNTIKVIAMWVSFFYSSFML